MEIDEAGGGGGGEALALGDGGDFPDEPDGVGDGGTGEKQIEVVGGDAAALGGLGDLDDGEKRMALAGVFAHDRQDEMGAAAAQAREIFHPVFGLARDDVESGVRERLAVGEAGVGRPVAEERGAEGGVGEEGVALGQQDGPAGVDDGEGDGGEGGGGGCRDGGGAHEAEREGAEVGGNGRSGRERGEFFGEPGFDFAEGFFDAAVELDAGPAEPGERDAGVLELAPHDVVRDFFAAVFEEEGGGDVGVRDVAAVGAVEELVHRLAAEAAAFGVGEGDEARDAVGPAEVFFVEPLGGEARDLGGTKAGRQHEGDAFGGGTVVGGVDRERRRRKRVGVNALHPQRDAVGGGAGAEGGEARGVGLAPVAPKGDLGMAGVFALGAAAAGGGEEEFEVFRDEGREVLAVEVAAGIDVHLVDEELVAPRGRGDLEGRHEREVGDGAVAGDEEEQVAAGGDLAGDALEVVARAVHEVEAGLRHRLGVIDHVVDAGAGIFLVCGAEGFEDDVVEAAKFVAGGGVGLGGDAVPREARGEGGDFFEESAGGRDIARTAEKVGLGADDLVGLAEVARAAVADHLVHEGAGEGIAGYAGKRVGAAALEGDAEGGDRLGGARQGVGGGEPGADDALALGETGGEAAGEGEEMMRDVGEGIAAFFHEVAEEGVGDGLDAVVDGEDGGDVRVRHETGETTEDLGGVVGLVGSAALGVRDGDDAVEAGVDAGERLEAGGELAGVAGGAGGGAEDDDDVARADAAAAGAAVALERARGGEEFDGRRGDESAFVQPERIEDIGEIGGGGEREAVDAADGEGGEHRGVAHVIAGGEVGEGGAEGEAPREQGGAGRDGGDGEAVAFEHGVREGARAGRQGEDGAGIEATRGDGDVVAGGGESADGGESERGGRHGGKLKPRWAACRARGAAVRPAQRAKGRRRWWRSASFTGFERNWFMPAAVHRACSSGRAAAVRAMMGRSEAVRRSAAGSPAQLRMRRVVSQPSSFGMWQSIKITSGNGACSSATRASSPSPASVNVQPRRMSWAVMIFWFTGLSSATSTRRWRSASSWTGAAVERGASVAGGSGRVKWKTEPWPGALWTPMVPPMSCTRRELMASPRPEPPKRRVVEESAWVKRSKMRVRASASMPMPVSRTSKRRVAGVGALTSSCTWPPAGVNLIALEIRFSST